MALGKSHRLKQVAHYHILADFPLILVYPSSETCNSSRNPTKMDEYTQIMIQRRFTRGQGSQEGFLPLMDLGQYRSGNRVQQLDTDVNHSRRLSRNKRLV